MKNLFFRRATLVGKKPCRVSLSSSRVVRPQGLTLTGKRDHGYEAKGVFVGNMDSDKICANLCSIKWWRYTGGFLCC